MNKSELIEVIIEETKLTKKQVGEVLDAFTKATTGVLREGEKLTLVGFGIFSVSDVAARTGRNPKTGEAVEISARKAVKFKAGKQLLESIGS